MPSIGTPVLRREDYRFLTGQGTYTVDANGRFAVMVNGLCAPCGYLTGVNQGIGIYDSNGVNQVLLEKQALYNTGPFSLASILGAYSFGNRGYAFPQQQTASGENFDMYDMTAAHPTLPLGSYVKVTNLHNGRAVVVKVNDRGPIVQGRIIDLSFGAAQVLQFHDHGLQKVRLDVVKRGTSQHRAILQTIAANHPVAQLP